MNNPAQTGLESSTNTLPNNWKILNHDAIGVVPGAPGQRAFPTAQAQHADPFVLLDHIGPKVMPCNFHMDGHLHPHRGFETITFMFNGNLNHVDNFGNRALLSSGGVQHMNAGRGISHGGDMWAEEDSNDFHEIQLWVNSPANEKMSEPSVHNFTEKQIPLIENQHHTLRVIAGSQLNAQQDTIEGPIKTFADIAALHGIARSHIKAVKEHQNVKATLQIKPKHNTVLVYPLTGSLQVNLDKDTIKLQSQQSLLITQNTLRQINLSHIQGEYLLLSGCSLNEPVVMGGPFVMNSQAEILQAKKDYQAGYFD